MSPGDTTSDMPSQITLNQSQFHDVLNALPDATFVVGENGDIVFASIKSESTYGYKPDDLVGQKIEVLVPEAYRKNHVKHRDVYFNKPNIRLPGNGLELLGQRKDGSTFPAEIGLNHIKTGQGVLAICTVRDLSERKITEKLLINDERFQLLMQNTPSAIAMFDKDMRYLVASKRWLEDYGLAGQDIIGRSHYEIFPDIPERWKDVHRRCLEGETLRAEEDIFRRADGTADWVRWEMRPWHANDGKIGGAILFTEVITRRKQAELELKKSTERFRTIFDNAVMGIAVGELESGKFHLANQAYCRLLGYTTDELKAISFKTLVHPDDSEAQKKEIARIAEEGVPSVDFINRYLKKNGEPVWVRKIVQPFPANPGEPQLLMATVMDYSAVKQAEDELKTSHENLERLVKERTHELDLAMREAERADSIKTRFLTAAGHDLRQPLQSAGLFLSVLSQTNNNPQHQEICESMQLALETMGTLLNGLLDISKFQSGKVVPNLQDFSLDAMLNRIVSDNLPQAKAKGLNLTYQTDDCDVHSDPDLLERIIDNLMTNAIRYTQEGSVSISCDRTEEVARISIRDTGIGIPEHELNNIFDEYYQLGNPGRDRRKGLGLGLAIVKHIAQVLSHPVEVQSELGKGSVFTVTAPLGHPDQRRKAVSGSGSAYSSQEDGIEAMLIEDDPLIAKAMKILFEQAKIRLYTAQTGEEAIDQIQAGLRPDVIVSDYRLPGCNGIETIKSIRSLVVDTIPAIIISGDTSLKQIEDEKLPLCQVFLKPVDAQKLISTILDMVRIKNRT